MTFCRRLVCAGAVFLCAALGVGAHAQEQMVRPAPSPQAPQAVGTGAITGVVVDAVGDRPIAGAIVTLEYRRPPLPRQTFVQITTPKGRFAFLDLPAGDGFALTTAKPGYLDGGYGREVPLGPSAPMSVKDGQWLSDVRVVMSKPGSISGIVTDERGEPVVGVSVRMLPQVVIAGRMQWLAGTVARTDDRGAYRIPGLGPGKYLVSVPSVQATLPASATIRTPTASAGTSLTDLRAASEAARAEKLLVDAGAGQQLVVGRHTVPPAPSSDGRRLAYPIAFYPGAPTPADATVVELRASQDRVGVDIPLQPVRTARVSGAVVGPVGSMGNLLLRLIPVGLEELGQGSEAATTVTSLDGRFTFLDVPSGSYVLDSRHALMELTSSAVTQASTAVPAPVPFPSMNSASFTITAAPPGVQGASLNDGVDVAYFGQLHVEVNGADQDNLTLPLRRPSRLRGRMVWAPGSKPDPNASPRPRLEPADARRSLGALNVAGVLSVGDWFTIDGMMAGEYLLRVTGANVESITWDGQDYSDRPFDATSGREFADVLITLTTVSSPVTGIVNDGNAVMTSGAAVVAFPVERERWSNYGFNPTRLTSVLTGSDGRFRVEGLPAGEYYFVAVPAAQERNWIDPAFLASHAGRATRVRIERGGAAIAAITLSVVK